MHADRADSVQRWHIQVSPRRSDLDGHGRDVLADVRQIGLEHVEGVRSSRIYLLEGSLLETDRKSTRLNSSHIQKSRMPSSA